MFPGFPFAFSGVPLCSLFPGQLETHGVRRFIEQAAAFRGALASSSSNFGSG